jgi:hypothetical protein
LAEFASHRQSGGLTRIAAALALAATFGLGASAARADDCAASPQARIVLAADSADPDVFVWDDLSRLAGYSRGTWAGTSAIMAHTVLAHPGTKAVVLACLHRALRAKYSVAEDDAIRVRMLSGPYRGRFGWVASPDVHPAR